MIFIPTLDDLDKLSKLTTVSEWDLKEDSEPNKGHSK
jgi:hypothetical protein